MDSTPTEICQQGLNGDQEKESSWGSGDLTSGLAFLPSDLRMLEIDDP